MDDGTQRMLAFALVGLGLVALLVGLSRPAEARLLPLAIGVIAGGQGAYMLWAQRGRGPKQ